MRTVNIDRDKLLEIVKENRVKHIHTYREVSDNFLKAAIATFEKSLARLKNGEIVHLHEEVQGLERPRCFDSHYAKIIRMLELTEDKVIQLTDQEFSQYVLDEWEWKRDLCSMNATYMRKMI